MSRSPGYSFCEPVTATTMSHEHIRAVGAEGIKRGGGIPAEVTALCGYEIARGWDNGGEVTEQTVALGQRAETNPVCTPCAAAWRRAQGTRV